MVAAASELDVRRLIELTSPDEMEVLHDYGPLLVDAVGDAEADDEGSRRGQRPPARGPRRRRRPEGGRGHELRGVRRRRRRRLRDPASTAAAPRSPPGTRTRRPSHRSVRRSRPSTCPARPATTSTTLPSRTRSRRRRPRPRRPASVTESAFSPMGLLGTFGSAAAAPAVRRGAARRRLVPRSRRDTMFDTLLAGLRAVETEDVRAVTRMWTGEAEWLWYGDEFWEECGVEQPDADGLRARRRSRAGGVLRGPVGGGRRALISWRRQARDEQVDRGACVAAGLLRAGRPARRAAPRPSPPRGRRRSAARRARRGCRPAAPMAASTSRTLRRARTAPRSRGARRPGSTAGASTMHTRLTDGSSAASR